MKIVIGILVLVVFLGCGDGTGRDIEIGDPSDFVIDIRELRLTRELGTVHNIPILQEALGFEMKPLNATRNTLKWTSSNPTVATVSDTGEITITSDNPLVPRSTTIRVESEYDPSVFAECTLTVYPVYLLPRTWNFNTVRVNNAVITASIDSSTSNWTSYSQDGDLTGGAIILGSSGGVSDYNGLGPGEYEIDPADPYKHGVIPNGGPRSWQYGSAGNVPSFTPAVAYPLVRPAGMGRFIQINAVQGPFRIEVDYQGNNTSGSQVDIRIGDTQGWRIEGEPSMGSAAVDGKRVSYDFRSSDFVPAVYLETNEGTRIWAIRITRISLDP